MTVQLAFDILDVVVFAALILALSAVSVRPAAGEGPVMRRSPKARDRRIVR